MNPFELRPGEARRLEAVRAATFGRGWRPGRDGVVSTHEPTRATTSREVEAEIIRARILAIVAARYSPGDVVSTPAVAELAEIGHKAAYNHVAALKAEGRWPYAPGQGGRPRTKGGPSCR